MSVKKEPSGRRSVQVEVEVPGTPEEVWEAIATSRGVSSWFVPTEIDGRVGGSIVIHMGPGMDGVAEVTGWEPPHRLTAEGNDWGAGAPPVATEWTVEARSGDTCMVRVVHSLFASSDDWDDQLEGTESGWPPFFEVLRLYLTHFRGQECSTIRVHGAAAGPMPEAWAGLVGALGLAGAAVGQRAEAEAAGMPALSGFVEGIHTNGHSRAIVRLERPAPGIASIAAHPMGDQILLAIGFFLYGEGASATVAHDEPLWQAWMAEHYPMGG